MHVILPCPKHHSTNFTKYNKQFNDIKCTNFLHAHVALIKYLGKMSQLDHVWSTFIIIINILHVSLELLSTPSLVGYCHFKKPSDVITDITTTVLSFKNGGEKSSCKDNKYQHLYFDIFIISWLQLNVFNLNMSPLSLQNMNLYKCFSEIHYIFVKLYTVTLLIDSCCQLMAHHVLIKC